MHQLGSLISGPWVVSRDFNTVRHPSEKKNCNRIKKSMTDFSEFIEDMELIDFDLTCGQFSWKQGDRQATAARLDRFLVSEGWNTHLGL